MRKLKLARYNSCRKCDCKLACSMLAEEKKVHIKFLRKELWDHNGKVVVSFHPGDEVDGIAHVNKSNGKVQCIVARSTVYTEVEDFVSTINDMGNPMLEAYLMED